MEEANYRWALQCCATCVHAMHVKAATMCFRHWVEYGERGSQCKPGVSPLAICDSYEPADPPQPFTGE